MESLNLATQLMMIKERFFDMNIININSLKSFIFPGGEINVNASDHLIGGREDIYLFCLLKSSNDIIKLLMAIDAIKSLNPINLLILVLPYLPYARQDRVCNLGEAFGIKVMANLINSLGCGRVVIYDPHSDVCSALINNCHAIDLYTIFSSTRSISILNHIRFERLSILSPDAGAEKKIYRLATLLNKNTDYSPIEVICASKKRNTMDGSIIDTQIHGDVKDKNLIIIDDICDGGSTFIKLAIKAKQQGAKSLILYVTHGIFSKGLEILFEHFDYIYCYYTFLEKDVPLYSKLKIIGEFNDH